MSHIESQIQSDHWADAQDGRQFLNDVRIVDLSIVTAGGGSTQLLGDFGADVIKVESTSRPDPFRHWNGVTGEVGGAGDLGSAPFRTVNRNKRAIDINLRTSDGAATLLELVRHSDVVIENFRRGVLDRLGIGFEQLKAANPNVVLMSMSSQGEIGPESGFGSFGSTLDALGGIMAVTGYEPSEPKWSGNKVNFPDQIVSLIAPMLVVAGVRYSRERGEGCWIDLAQREVVTYLLGELLLWSSLTGVDPQPAGNLSGDGFEGCFACAGDDEWVTISLTTDDEWNACCSAIGAAWLATSFGASVGDTRLGSELRLRDLIAGWCRDRSKLDAMTELQAAGVPATAVMKGFELLADEFFRARDFFTPVPLPESDAVELQRGLPFTLDRQTNTRDFRRAPHLGEHTDEILTGLLGLDAETVRKFRAAGVVG